MSRALGDGLEATSVQHEPQGLKPGVPPSGTTARPGSGGGGAGWGSGQSIRWGYSWRHPVLAAEMFGIDGWGRTSATWWPRMGRGVGLGESQLLRQ